MVVSRERKESYARPFYIVLFVKARVLLSMDDSTQRRLAENEVIFRAVNEDAQDVISHTKGDETQLDFYKDL